MVLTFTWLDLRRKKVSRTFLLTFANFEANFQNFTFQPEIWISHTFLFTFANFLIFQNAIWDLNFPHFFVYICQFQCQFSKFQLPNWDLNFPHFFVYSCPFWCQFLKFSKYNKRFEFPTLFIVFTLPILKPIFEFEK